VYRPLTDRQRSILDFISSSTRQKGPPSYREIAAHFRITASGLHKQIRALEAKGVLRRPGHRAARGLQVVSGAEIGWQVRLPILGQVRAGLPVEAVENMEDHIVLDRTLAKSAHFVLRVKGDSMYPEILEGDLLLVRQGADAQSGDHVVAHVGNAEATVKRLRKARGEVWLEAANPEYPAIHSQSLKVVGRVVGLLRQFR
jgi:repressor LexA